MLENNKDFIDCLNDVWWNENDLKCVCVLRINLAAN